MLFGEIYSSDHPEYYYTCAWLITYAEYKTDKNYTLEHTKPSFNKHVFLTLYLAGFSRILKNNKNPLSYFTSQLF